jgi:hypothetical protein
VAVLTALAQGFDVLGNLIGARRFGAGRAGLWGGAVGAVVGLVLLPPWGFLLGAFAGATGLRGPGRAAAAGGLAGGRRGVARHAGRRRRQAGGRGGDRGGGDRRLAGRRVNAGRVSARIGARPGGGW